jgi:PQQ-like domain
VKKEAKTLLIVAVVAFVVVAGISSYLVLAPQSKGPAKSNSPTGASGSGCPTSESAAGGNWSTYHQNGARTGYEGTQVISSAHQLWTVSGGLDGQVYAEPLVCGDTVYVVTEDDSVYALNASTGAVDWRTHLGTPVPGNTLPCGDIDPSGITGTPVIDAATGVLYAVAFVAPHQHVLFGVNVVDGAVVSQMGVDPTGADPTVEQQRGALALANDAVYIPYGGLDGDCGQYHGWVVGAPLSGTGSLLSYQVPTGREGGIWATAGITVTANGDLLVATGNSEATKTFDYGDAVILLSPSLTVLDYFAPTNWAQLNSGDVDLGSVAPTLLPNGDIFQIGKQGEGYLLSGTHLGGIGGQVNETNVCGGSYGGTARVGQSILVPCVDGLTDVRAGPANLTVEWEAGGFDSGAPIVTGNVAWAVDIDNASLLGFNLTSGQPLFGFSLGSVDHFISPAAGPGSIFVGAGDQVYCFALA